MLLWFRGRSQRDQLAGPILGTDFDCFPEDYFLPNRIGTVAVATR